MTRVCVFGGSAAGAAPSYTRVAHELGAALARAGLGLVYGGGGVGVMGAVSDGALAAGGEVIGVIPGWMVQREYGRTDLADLRIVGSMHERKQLMHDLSAGFIALPGGLGTLEELFEAVTWTQLGLHDKHVVLLNVDGYYDPLLKLVDHAVEAGFLRAPGRSLILSTTDVDEAIALARRSRFSPLTFRRVTRDDFGLLARWLEQPLVRRWWNHEFTPEAVERDFGSSADGTEPNQDWLALHDGEPFGLIQFSHWTWYPEYVEEVSPILDLPDGAVSIDYLIGDPERLGVSAGPAMIRAFVDRIWATDPEASCVIVPVALANRRSWRALEKAGFTRVAEGELEPDNPIDNRDHVILRLDRPGP